jgi:hypothetical protein
MIAWLKKILTAAYAFWCYEIWQRREFYTPQLTRMRIHHGVFWSLGFIGIVLFIGYHLFNEPTFWESVFLVSALLFLAWLDDHLVDYARQHPEIME